MGGPEDDDKSGVTVADTPRTRASAALGNLPGRFTVGKTLGEGGMGTVVEAYDKVLSRDVAIKVLARDHLNDPAIGARFLREARAAARLRHPGIVQVHDIDPDGGFIVMELVRGESLATRLRRERTLPATEVRRIGRAMLDALAIAHAGGIVHRDVKPANVLLGDDGAVKLADFGVAFFGDSDLTIPGTRIGTPAYMPPEQLRAKEVDASADVYSAGATLYEAATGKRLTDDESGDPRTAVIEATADRVLANAIARAVKERPADRFSDGAAFATALDATEAPTVTTTAPIEMRTRWRSIALAAVAIVALGGAGYGILRARSSSPPAPVHHAIALLPFTDKTANPLLDFAAAGLPNLLGLELHGMPDVNVVGYYQLLGVAGTDASPAAWTAAAKQLGADVIVRGELTASAANVHIVIAIETGAGARLDTIERDATVEGVPEVVRHTAPALVEIALGHKIAAPVNASPSFAADRELQLGIAELEREHIDEAVDHLRNAIHHSPRSALAHYYLATALSWRSPPVQPAHAEIEKALALGGLDDAQREFLRGMRHIVDQDFVGGIQDLRASAETFPDDRDILYALFEALFHGGHPAEAMSVYHRIVKLAPKFRLALIHTFTFYVSHADDDGMSWALALGDPTGDSYSRLWESRILMARREYPSAIKFLSRRIQETKDETAQGELQSELATAYVVSDQLDLASSLVTKLGEPNHAGIAAAEAAIAAARGDVAARAKWTELALRTNVTQPLGPSRTIGLTILAGTVLAAASRDELGELSKLIEDSIVADYSRSLNLNVIEVLLAESQDDAARLAAFAKSPYPEVSELAAAAIARRSGDHATAATATRRSIAASGDARYLLDQWWRVAGDLHALADHAGVLAACDEVLRPRLYNWSWGATAGDCLAWSAEADEALGKRDDARALWKRLLATRNAAPPTDPLVTAARAALVRLR